MNKLRLVLGLVIGLLLIAPIGQAQTSTNFEIFYDETQNAFFEGNEFTHVWFFFGEARDIFSVKAHRIAGQFTPRLSILDAGGNLIAESTGNPFSDTDELIFEAGLPEDAPYQLLIEGVDVQGNQRDNPAEYSLTLTYDGKRRADPNEGLAPLPDVGLAPLPELATGDATPLAGLNLTAYGNNVVSQRSDTPDIPIRFTVQSGDSTLFINNNNPLSQGVSSITFIDDLIALQVQNSQRQGFFVSDEDVQVAFNPTRLEYIFDLQDTGTRIITDFFRVQAIEVRDGIVVARVNTDGTERRFIFNGALVDIRRLAGNAESGEEATNAINLENNQSIVTDFEGYDTLAYLDGELRVLINDDSRFIMEDVRVDLRQNNTNRSIYEIDFRIPTTNNQTRPLRMQVDWRNIGEIAVREDNLTVQRFNGTLVNSSLSNLSSVLLQNSGVRLGLVDGSFYTSLPDGTEFTTPSSLPDNSDVLPHEAEFRPRNHNNLGEQYLTMCPCVQDFLENKPVNPANGNFYYSVTDFHIPSHTVELEFTRYYNSQDTGLTPNYMLNNSAAYLAGQLGEGWRHTYQYDLDISGAPAGRIHLIEPDGTQHLFFPTQADPTIWQSRTLLTWRITQVGGVLGTWEGRQHDGVTFYFDRAGRLERISESLDRSVTITPMPFNYDVFGAGAFIVEPYGRRIELYVGATGRIEQARDTSARQISYFYDTTRLINVEYITATQVATYGYDDLGILAAFDDSRSPYLQEGRIEYDQQRRVSRYISNPDGNLRQDYRYSYAQEDDERITTQTASVRGQARMIAWTYNALFQLTNRSTPREDFAYEFTYDETTGLLSSFRTPTLVRYFLTFDNRGNLTQFEDPFFAGQQAYNFTYEQRNGRNILTEANHPNGGEDIFIWSNDPTPRLLAHQELVSVGAERNTRQTRYEYDDWGRLIMVVTPDNIATVYFYDNFGYVETIWEGVQVDNEETRADIPSSNSALRILRFDYDLIGQVRAVTDGRGQTYTLNWDSSIGKLRELNGPNNVSISYNFDERGRVTLVNDRQRETLYTYNGLDLPTSVRDALGGDLVYEYDEAGNVLSVTDNLLRTTRFRYDELDNPIERTSPANLVTRYETLVEEDFVVQRTIDPANRAITRLYDSLGRLRRYTISTAEFEQEFRIEYNAINLPTEIREALTGRALTLEYDLVGQVQSVRVAGSETQFDYSIGGLLTEVTSPAGRVTQYDYDALGNITEVVRADGSLLTYSYDENSNLLTTSNNAADLTTTFVYDALNQLVSQEDPDGLLQSYTYDVRGNLTTVIDPRGSSRTFTYDALDRLTQATDGRGQTTTYQYDPIGNLINIQKPGVRSTRLTYDAENNIIAVTERPLEQRTLYSYDELGRISSITDPLGHTTAYIYNPLGSIRRVIDAQGNIERYLWRQGVNTLFRYIDNGGQEYEFTADTLGRVTTVRDRTTEQNTALNTEFFYDADGYVQGIQTGTDNARVSGNSDIFHRYEYNALGLPVRYTDPYDGVWQLEYDGADHLIAVIDPRGIRTEYERDDSGRIVSVIDNAGTDDVLIEQYIYDENGNITRYIAPDGTINRYRYDSNNLLLQATVALDTPLESTYNFTYNGIGQLISTEDPLGTQTEYVYSQDNLRRLERELGEERLATLFEYDDFGNLRGITLPGRDEETNAPIDINLTYDALNRRVRYVDGENSVWSYSYDANGNIAQIGDPLGSVVQYEYDSYDRVRRITYPTGSGTVELRYDVAGNIRTVILPPNDNGSQQAITYVIDVRGNVTEMRVGNDTTIYSYDANGNMTRRVRPNGQTTTYAYDGFDRLMSITYDDGRVVPFAYDAAGHLTTAGDLRFAYDNLERLTLYNDGEQSIQYTYDLAGNLLTRDAGEFGRTEYEYDDLYRPIRVTMGDESIQIIYDNLGRIRQLIRNNRVRTISNYDAVGRPTSILHLLTTEEGNQRLDGFTYEYDAVGNVIGVDRVVDDWRILYSYDVAYRLIDERWLNDIDETAYAVSFRYDEAGNRIEELRNGRRTEFFYNERNQLIGEDRNSDTQSDNFLFLPIGFAFIGLIGISWRRTRRRRRWLLLPILGLSVSVAFAQQGGNLDVRYEYDRSGNLISIDYLATGDELTLRYDAENRLIAVTGTDSQSRPVDSELTYDSLSRIQTWRSGEEAYRLVWDNRTLLGMLNLDTGDIEHYLTLNDERLLTVIGDETLWNLNDQLGSTRSFVDEAGQLITDPAYDLEFGSFGSRIFPYNNSTVPEDASLNKLRSFFAGELYDPSANLYLLGLRAYDPNIGRFLQTDPVPQDPIGTLYTYARNRPFVFGDDTGMTAQAFVAPIDAANLITDIEPDNLLPRPVTLDIPLPPAVHRAQADESFRAFELLKTLRYGTNATVAEIAPQLDNLYMFGINPMPQPVRDLSIEPLDAVMSIYHEGDGWLPDPRTNPIVPRNPYTILEETQPLLAQAYIEPLTWCCNSATDTTILPIVEIPQGLPTQWVLATGMEHTLQQVSLMSVVESQTNMLTSTVPNVPSQVLPDPSVPIPSISIEPPVLQSLDDLREAMFDTIQPIWQPNANCVDCVSAIGFSR